MTLLNTMRDRLSALCEASLGQASAALSVAHSVHDLDITTRLVQPQGPT